MNENLSESKRRLLEAIRREMLEITQPVLDISQETLDEVQALRREQKDRHEAGLQKESDAEQIRRVVRRIAHSLLVLVDRDEKPK